MTTETANWTGCALSQGRYVIRALLGEGGMAVVYRARDRHLDCDVVIKVPRRSMLEDPEFAGRFTREIRSLVRLVHPHIVKILDVGEQGGIPFAVLQYFSGGSLRDRQGAALGRGPETTPQRGSTPQRGPSDAGGHGVLPPEHLADWLEDVAGALDFIHAQHFIHRDVKPDNILFDEPGNAYLSDFGIAKVVNDGRDRRQQTVHTGTGLLLGTPQYMAPELLLGRPYDGRADQYALAVTVYELLSGRYPYDAPTPAALCMLQSTQPPPWLGEAAPAVPRALSQAVQKALAMNPADRYPDCLSFAQDVCREIAGACEDLVRAIPSVGQAVAAGRGTAPPSAPATQMACPSCRKALTLPPGTEGRRIWCPWCEAVFRVGEKPSTRPAGRAASISFDLTRRETRGPGPQETGSNRIWEAEEKWRAQSAPLSPASPGTGQEKEGKGEARRPRRPARPERLSWLVPAIVAGGMLLAVLILAAVLLWNRSSWEEASGETVADARPAAQPPAEARSPDEAPAGAGREGGQPPPPLAAGQETSPAAPEPARGRPPGMPYRGRGQPQPGTGGDATADQPPGVPYYGRIVYLLVIEPQDASLTLQGPGRVEGSGGQRRLVVDTPISGQSVVVTVRRPGFVPEQRTVALRPSTGMESLRFSLKREPPPEPATVAAAPKAELVPVYRMVIPGDVILTPFDQEVANLRRQWPGPFNGNNRGHQEEILGYSYAEQRPGTVRLHRYSLPGGQHLFTIKPVQNRQYREEDSGAWLPANEVEGASPRLVFSRKNPPARDYGPLSSVSLFKSNGFAATGLQFYLFDTPNAPPPPKPDPQLARHQPEPDKKKTEVKKRPQPQADKEEELPPLDEERKAQAEKMLRQARRLVSEYRLTRARDKRFDATEQCRTLKARFRGTEYAQEADKLLKQIEEVDRE